MIDRGSNRKDTLIAFGDDNGDEFMIAHKQYGQSIRSLGRFLPFAYPNLAHYDPEIARGGLNGAGDHNTSSFEIPGSLIFGAGTSIDGTAAPQKLASAYLGVAEDIELGSLKRNITNIALYNRGYWAHMHMTGGRIHSLGPVAGGGKPGFFVVSEGSQPPSGALAERDNGPLPGAGILLLRGNKPDAVNPAPVRLRIDGHTLGNPAPNRVLVSRDAEGTVEWRDNTSSLQIYSGTGSHGQVVNIGSFTIPQCHFQIAPRNLEAEWGKGIQMIDVYVQNDAGTPRVYCKFNVEEGGAVRDCDRPHATSWTAFCQN
jgi:hypothetical protein